jgi:ribosomal protein S18 acetylase RimI-like enzyme
VITTGTAAPGERRAVVALLARAFADDPVYAWTIPDQRRRRRRLPRLMATIVDVLHAGMGPIEVARTDAGLVGVAAWDEPGQVDPGRRRGLRALPVMAWAMGRRLPGFGELGGALASLRPTEPHWYLFHLGVEPGWQGHGVGTALLRPGLARCDAEHRLAHLECKPGNVAYYRRFGFEVADAVPFAGVDLVTMTRSPRPTPG